MGVYIKTGTSSSNNISYSKPIPTQVYYLPAKRSISSPVGWVDAATSSTSITFNKGMNIICVGIGLKQISNANHFASACVRLFNKTTNSAFSEGTSGLVTYEDYCGVYSRSMFYASSNVTYSCMPQFVNNYTYCSIYNIFIKVIRLNNP